MKLRDYQIEIVEELIASLTKHDRIVVACPTGGGKTVIAVDGILPNLPHPVAWVTHRRELARQIELHGTAMDVVMSQSPTKKAGYRAIIIDEGHHVCASQYRQIIEANSEAKIVCLTATPYRTDGQGLGSVGFTKIIYGPDIFTLTQLGHLCPASVFVPKSETQKAWDVASCAGMIASRNFTRGIVYCRTVKDAHELAAHLGKHFPSAAVDGSTNILRRDSITKKFKAGKFKVICNHTIFTEGYDLPTVDLIVLNRFTESRCLWRQMIGRGLRTAPNKTICTVLDLAGNGIAHGSIYDREIFDLHGTVAATEQRDCPSAAQTQSEYTYNQTEELKEWKPAPKPVRIIESLQKLNLQSPLRRFMTAPASA